MSLFGHCFIVLKEKTIEHCFLGFLRFSAFFLGKKGVSKCFGVKNLETKREFWSFLVRDELSSQKRYGRCEEDKFVLHASEHDIRSCAVVGQLKS